MDINKMTRKDFEMVPSRKWNEDVGLFDCLVILPTRRKHDSGYRCMDFVGVRNDEPICLLSGGSDVVHIEGIGGFGNDWLKKYKACPRLVPPTEWSLDCLPVSGLLRLFARGKIKVGSALSSFEIYQVKEEEEDNAK